MVIVIGDLAIEAIKTFVHVNFAAPLDGAHRAHALADVALAATLGAALQPVEHAHAAQDRQARAQRADEAAIEALDEQPGAEQRHGIDNGGPRRVETERDRGLERLDAGPGDGQIEGIERRPAGP